METVVASSKEISTDAPFTFRLPVFSAAAETVKTRTSNITEKTIAYFIVFPFILLFPLLSGIRIILYPYLKTKSTLKIVK